MRTGHAHTRLRMRKSLPEHAHFDQTVFAPFQYIVLRITINRLTRVCTVQITGRQFLMTDSICHSSLPRTVLETVTLTTNQFRFYPRTKVDPMFQCVYISTPLKSCSYKSSATCAWSMARVAEKTRFNICVNNKGADQPARPRKLISTFVVRYSSFFFDEEASHKLKWRTEWYREFISFS